MEWLGTGSVAEAWPEGAQAEGPKRWKLEMNRSQEEKTEWASGSGVLVRGTRDRTMKRVQEAAIRREQNTDTAETPTS